MAEANHYCEAVLKVRFSQWEKLTLPLLWIMTAVYFLAAWFLNGLLLTGTLVFAVLALWWGRRLTLEYEYQFLGGVLQIDKVLRQTKRKKCGSFDLARLVLMAPEGEESLAPYLKGAGKGQDFTTRVKEAPGRYVAVFQSGSERKVLLLEPGEEMVQMMWRAAPSKVLRERKTY